jgi:4-diphosphocytidyl-2-C-methyl-D-erythritol kinase
VSVYRALAPAKVNLGLFLGPPRASDGRHELVSVMQSISLADELTLEPAPAAATQDEVQCPSVPAAAGENLAARALAAFRARTGWNASPLRLSILKRIPIAGGLGGGSADAAAALRLASLASGLGDEQLLRELGGELGADVPAQVSPGRWLATGAGEELQALPDPNVALGVLVLPAAAELSTAAVYVEADRLGLGRPSGELQERRTRLRRALELGAQLPAERDLLENDLQPAAVSLAPRISDVLREARGAGADEEVLSGSGPTVVALFARANSAGAVERAAADLSGRSPAPIAARSVGGEFGRAAEVERGAQDSAPT